MPSILKNVYTDKIDSTVNEYNNLYHRTIRMKPINVKTSTYIDFGAENNDKGPKFEVGDHVEISKYKNYFVKCYTQNWSEKFFIKKS